MQVKRSMYNSYFTEVMLRKGSKVNHMPLQEICPHGDHDFHAVLISGDIEIPGEDVVFEDGFFLCSGTQKEINIQSSGAAAMNIQHSDT